MADTQKDRRSAVGETAARRSELWDIIMGKLYGVDEMIKGENLEFNGMGNHVGIMVGQGLDTVRVQALFTDPGEGLFLKIPVRGDPGEDLLFPGLDGIAAISE